MNNKYTSLIDAVVGHNAAKNLLKESLKRQKIASFYLFSGPESVGKTTLAWALIQHLACQKTQKGLVCQTCRSCKLVAKEKHPDVTVITAEGAIGLPALAPLREKTALTPNLASRRIVLITEAEKMTREAANSLLKILEEPKGEQVFILITMKPEKILATIRSRSQHVKMSLVELDKIQQGLIKKGAEPVLAQNLAQISEGRPGRAFDFFAEPRLLERQKKIIKNLWNLTSQDVNQRFVWAEKLAVQKSESLIKILNIWLVWFREVLLWKTGASKLLKSKNFPAKVKEFGQKYTLRQILGIIKSIMEIKRSLESKANPRLALETLLLNI